MARRGDGIYRRGPTWWLDFTHRGERHALRLGRGITKTTARELAAVQRAAILKGEAGIGGPKGPAAAPTLHAYATAWLGHVESQVEAATFRSYRQTLHNHILPVFGETTVDAITLPAVKAFLEAKAGTLARNSVQIIRATLSVVLADAVEDGLIAANMMRGLSARKKRRRAGAVTKADRARLIRPLTLQGLGALLDASRGREHEWVLFLTLADAGLRPGEALALRWDDLDAAAESLHVARAVTLGGALKGTKTGIDRHVELTPRLMAALRRWHMTSQVEALAAGRELTWMFPSPAGATLRVQTVSKRFRRVREQAGVPAHHRLYDLRHTYASHALMLGAPITYVAAQLGHSSPAITLSVYARWLPRPDRLWAKRLQESREFHNGIHNTARDGSETPALSARG